MLIYYHTDPVVYANSIVDRDNRRESGVRFGMSLPFTSRTERPWPLSKREFKRVVMPEDFE